MSDSKLIFNKINNIIKDITELGVYPPLMWVWVWDTVVSIYQEYAADSEDKEYTISDGITLEIVWDKFWLEADKNGFSLQFGIDQLNEQILDWMIDSDFIVSLDDDGWLDD